MQYTTSNIVSLVLLLFCCYGFLSLLLMHIMCPSRAGAGRSVIYGVSLFLCGLCSYLYTTGVSDLPPFFLKKIDHAAIFLLIAGTYTPFASNLIVGPFRIRLLFWIWGVSIVGVVLQLIVSTGHEKLFVALYLTAGWIFLTALRQIVNALPRHVLILLGAGAVVYSLGAVIYLTDPGSWTVAVWHAFVLVAAALHYVAVLSMLKNPNAV